MMVMPSGRRSSEPMPVPSASGNAAEQRGHRGHHDRAEAQQAGLVDRLLAASCLRSRSASSAKSIIMIAFFFTMPISRMMPISAMTLKSCAADHQRQQRADAGRRQRRENRDRMDVALVQHAQHDVDRDERREDQQRLVGQRGLERLRRCPGSGAWMLARHVRVPSCALSIAVDRVAQRRAGRQVERERHDGKLALVIDRPAARSPARNG